MAKRKFLFLDIDGVLNSMPYLRSIWDNLSKGASSDFLEAQALEIDPSRVALVNRIVEQTGCLVVLSSAWRMYGKPAVSKWLQERGATFNLLDVTTVKISASRGQEIDHWIFENGGLDTMSICILDDSKDIDPLLDKHVWCHPDEGITPGRAELAIAMLNGDDFR